jgi:prephenate dehydratase
MPEGGLYIIGEHFQPIRHSLLSVAGATINGLAHIHSHVHAIPQCRELIRQKGLQTHIHADTAGAAAEVARMKDPAHAAIASELAADIYGLDILKHDIQDADHNTTRFLILSREPADLGMEDAGHMLTTLVFRVRNIPAALYKALGGFATNGVNMVKLESYVDAHFQAAQFYCDIEGHPQHPHVRLALEELDFFAREVTLLGTYKAHEFRDSLANPE